MVRAQQALLSPCCGGPDLPLLAIAECSREPVDPKTCPFCSMAASLGWAVSQALSGRAANLMWHSSAGLLCSWRSSWFLRGSGFALQSCNLVIPCGTSQGLMCTSCVSDGEGFWSECISLHKALVSSMKLIAQALLAALPGLPRPSARWRALVPIAHHRAGSCPKSLPLLCCIERHLALAMAALYSSIAFVCPAVQGVSLAPGFC